MDKPIRIFVEGDGDDLFLKKYLNHLQLPTIEIVPTGGYTKLHIETVTNQFLANTDAGGINLLIFDADTPETNGGFAVRKQYLEDKKTQLGITFETFLLPDNQNDGIFENLLEKIVFPENQFILDCFDTYTSCLETNRAKRELRLPALKSKIYAYWEIMPKSNKQNEAFKNKRDSFQEQNYTQYFDFDHSYLDPLKTFLETHFAT